MLECLDPTAKTEELGRYVMTIITFSLAVNRELQVFEPAETQHSDEAVLLPTKMARAICVCVGSGTQRRDDQYANGFITPHHCYRRIITTTNLQYYHHHHWRINTS